MNFDASSESGLRDYIKQAVDAASGEQLLAIAQSLELIVVNSRSAVFEAIPVPDILQEPSPDQLAQELAERRKSGHTINSDEMWTRIKSKCSNV